MSIFSVEKRWEYSGDPSQSPWFRVNVPYRYYIFYCCCANVLTIAINAFINSRIYHKRERLKKRLFGRLLIRAVNTPVWLQVVLWMLILLTIDLYPYYQDVYILHKPSYIHFKLVIAIWKRSGGVSYALIPFVLLLSLKPNPLPKVLYTNLLPLHKWSARIYIIMMGFHSVMFMQKWVSSGDFWKKFFKFDMLTGIISFFLWLTVLIVSIKPIRVRIYKSFYLLHIVATWTTIPLIYFHAKPDVNFFNYINLALLAYMVFSKIYFSVTNKYLEFLEVEKHINSQLFVLSMPKNYYEEELTFNPGSHIRINYRLINPLSWLVPSHPYTIASLDSDDKVKLIIKETNFKLLPLSRYNFSKPFSGLEPPFFKSDLNNHSITIVCGGSGIAFGLPLYRYFVENLMGNFEGLFLHFIWIVGNVYDLHILINFGILDIEGDEYILKSRQYENIDIYVTKDQHVAVEPAPVYNSVAIEKLVKFFRSKSNDYIEMDNYSDPSADDALLDDSQNNSFPYKLPNFVHEMGRPDLSLILSQDFQMEDKSNCLIACGPKSMLNDCSRLAKLNNAEFVSESHNF